jgi:hypothetical protein
MSVHTLHTLAPRTMKEAGLSGPLSEHKPYPLRLILWAIGISVAVVCAPLIAMIVEWLR